MASGFDTITKAASPITDPVFKGVKPIEDDLADWGTPQYDKFSGDLGTGGNAKEQTNNETAFNANKERLAKGTTSADSLDTSFSDWEKGAKTNWDNYIGARNGITNDFLKTYTDAKNMGLDYKAQADSQATDARNTYTNNIRPAAINNMEELNKQASQAMSLADYMDPNNKVAKGVRDMYETQAQGEGRQGLAANGVLQALGAQATAGQLGGLPITGGMLLASQGMQQSKASQAYANVQKRMQDLRDQGIKTGFERSDLAYNAGERARDRYSGSIKDLSGLEDSFTNRMGSLRNEGLKFGDYSTQADLAGTGVKQANFQEDFAHNQGLTDEEKKARDAGVLLRNGLFDQYTGQILSGANQGIQIGSATQAAKLGMFPAIIGSAAKVGAAAAGAPPATAAAPT